MLNETEEILNVATVTKTNTEKLLDLLNQSDDQTSGPIDELKSLLSAIVEILSHHTTALARLESACATVPPSDK